MNNTEQVNTSKVNTVQFMTLNKSTFRNIQTLLSQNRVHSVTQQQSVFESILRNGYHPEALIIINEKYNTVADGNTRLSAAIDVIRKGGASELIIPFMRVSDKDAVRINNAANLSSRGTTPEDLLKIIHFNNSEGELLTAANHTKAVQECKRAIQVVAQINNKKVPSDAEATAILQTNSDKFIEHVEEALAYITLFGITPSKATGYNYYHFIAALMVGKELPSRDLTKIYLTTSKTGIDERLKIASDFVDICSY